MSKIDTNCGFLRFMQCRMPRSSMSSWVLHRLERHLAPGIADRIVDFAKSATPQPVLNRVSLQRTIAVLVSEDGHVLLPDFFASVDPFVRLVLWTRLRQPLSYESGNSGHDKRQDRQCRGDDQAQGRYPHCPSCGTWGESEVRRFASAGPSYAPERATGYVSRRLWSNNQRIAHQNNASRVS